MEIQGSCKLHGCLVISYCTCDISPVPQTPQDSGLQYAPEDHGSPSCSTWQQIQEGHWYPEKLWGLLILLMGSQMCLPLTSHSHKTHFCLCIGDLLFETMEGPLSETMLLNTFWNVCKLARDFLNASFSLVWHLNSSSSSALCFQFGRTEWEGLGKMLEFPSVLV